jgi:hypothetical protein
MIGETESAAIGYSKLWPRPAWVLAAPHGIYGFQMQPLLKNHPTIGSFVFL